MTEPQPTTINSPPGIVEQRVGPRTLADESVLLVADHTPRQIPGYEILGELGRGGMGVVYKARHQQLNRLTAVKMILTGPHAGSHERERFKREAEAVASLQHPHIVQIYEVGEADGFPYLSLEFVEGTTLAEQLRGIPWPARQAATLVETLARATHHAHERGVIHRDLKPGNVLMAFEESHEVQLHGPGFGEASPRMGRPKITDFGLAKRFESSDGDDSDTTRADNPVAGQTRTGAVLGTPSYIAPEQAAGRNRDVGLAVDIYALGAILYELLTGRPPFRGESALDTVLQVMSNEPAAPRQLHSKIPRDLETICLKCLKKDPHRRYDTALSLAEDLQRFLAGQPILARPISRWERGVQLAKRRPTTVAMFLTVSVAVLTLLGISLSFNVQLRDAADREQKKALLATDAEALAKLRAKEALEQADIAQEAQIRAMEQQHEAQRQALLAQEEFERSRRSLYALQLTQVANLVDHDPARAIELLLNRRRCPDDLRDFTWSYLRRQSSRQEAVMRGHTEPVNSVCFSPDGQLLASAGWDGTARIWDVKTGRAWAILLGHEGLVLTIAFAPDGKSVATAGDDRSVRIWQLPDEIGAKLAKNGSPPADGIPYTLSASHLLMGHRDCVRSLAYSPDGNWLASGGSDRTVRVWPVPPNDAGEGMLGGGALAPMVIRERMMIPAHQSVVWSVAFSPDSRMIASGSDDKTVRLHELTDTDAKLIRTTPMSDAVLVVAFSPDGQTLASVCNTDEAVIHLSDVRTGIDRLQLRGHTRAVYGIAFSRTGKWLASGSFDRTVRMWDSETGEQEVVFKGHEASVRCVAFSPDRRLLASAGMDQTIRLWSIAGQPADSLILPKAGILTSATFSDDGQRLLTGGRDGVLRLWRSGTRSMEEIGSFIGPSGHITAVTMTRNARTIYSAGQDGGVRVWTSQDRVAGKPFEQKRYTSLPGMTAAVRTLMLSPDEQWLAVSTDRGVKLWNCRESKWSANFDLAARRSRGLAFSRDGQYLIAGVGRQLQVFSLATLDALPQVMIAHNAEIETITFDDRSRSVATADIEGMVRVWDWQAPQLMERAVLTGHNESVSTLEFTPDGRTLITGSRDRTIRLWDPMTGQERAALLGHSDNLLAVRLVGDPRQPMTLVSISRDGAVKWWSSGSR